MRWPDTEMPSPDEQVESTAAKLAKCELMVEGPPEPTWITTTPRDSLLLQEALSVVEVVHCMSASLDCKTVGLLQLQHACRFPRQTAVLPALYVALIRMCLLEVIQYETPSALRWPGVILHWAPHLATVLLACGLLHLTGAIPCAGVRAPFCAADQSQRLQQFNVCALYTKGRRGVWPRGCSFVPRIQWRSHLPHDPPSKQRTTCSETEQGQAVGAYHRHGDVA